MGIAGSDFKIIMCRALEPICQGEPVSTDQGRMGQKPYIKRAGDDEFTFGRCYRDVTANDVMERNLVPVVIAGGPV